MLLSRVLTAKQNLIQKDRMEQYLRSAGKIFLAVGTTDPSPPPNNNNMEDLGLSTGQ